MEASKLTNTPGYIPTTKMQILEFIQEDARNGGRFSRDTSAKTLGNLLADKLGILPHSAQCAINGMIHEGLLNRVKTNGHRGDISINYFSPLLPRHFIDTAPEKDKEYINKVYKMAAERAKEGNNVRIDDNGAVVSKPKGLAQNKPENEPENEPENDLNNVDEPTEATSDEPEATEEETQNEPENNDAPANVDEEGFSVIAVPMRVKREGRNIAITININLNA